MVIRTVVALAVIAASACTHRWRATDATEDGRRWYVSACASCHGESGGGDGPSAATLTVRPADLTTLSVQHGGEFPRGYVIDVVTGERAVPSHGTREMPVWNKDFGTAGSGAPAVASLYARRRVEALAGYVATLQRPRADPRR